MNPIYIPYQETRTRLSVGEAADIQPTRPPIHFVSEGNLIGDELPDTVKIISNNGVGKIRLAPDQSCSSRDCKSFVEIGWLPLGQWEPIHEDFIIKKRPCKKGIDSSFTAYPVDLEIMDCDGDQINDIIVRLLTSSLTTEGDTTYTLSTRIYNGVDLRKALNNLKNSSLTKKTS